MAWGQSKIRGTRAAGWRRLALDPLGGPPRWARAWDRASAAPQLSEQGQGAVSCETQKARGVTAAADAALAEPLGPRCARGRQPSGPQCQVRRAAHILEDKLPSLSRIDSNFFKRERARGLNESTAPKGKSCCSRAQHPFAKTIHSLVRSSEQMPSPGPQRGARSRRWRGGGDHSPPPPPRPARTIVLGSSPPRAPRVADAAPATRAARRLTPSRAPRAGKGGAGSRGRG